MNRGVFHLVQCWQVPRNTPKNLCGNEAEQGSLVTQSDIVYTITDVSIFRPQEITHTPVSVIVEDENLVYNALSLDGFLNFSVTFYNQLKCSDVYNSLLFDSRK